MTPILLRPYQDRVITETFEWFLKHQNIQLNPIVEACVGAGKSVIIAAFCQRALTMYPGTRILVVMHRKELAEQNIDKLRRIWPEMRYGIWSAALSRDKTTADITFATIGSIYKEAHLLGRIDLILADECHLINPAEQGMWRKLVSDLHAFGSKTRVVGFTGTPFRGNGVWLTEGASPLFTHVTGRVTMRELLDEGYLAPLIPAAAPFLIDTQGVSTTAGDWNAQELAERADRPDVVGRACSEIARLGAERRRWLVFCVNKAHARHVAEQLYGMGIACAAVTDDTPTREREMLIDAFRRGQLRCLVNVEVLTTGFDVPEVDFIALLRPTKSPLVYVQICGRGMRIVGANINESIANGKTNCLFADFTNTVQTLGPVDAIKGRSASKRRKGQAPVKACNNCGSLNPASARECSECGWVFPIIEVDPHGEHASGAAVLSDQLGLPPGIVQYEVSKVSYAIGRKEGGPQYLVVSYFEGVKRVAGEVLFFESHGARRRTQSWWYQRTASDDTPNTAQEALQVLQWRKARALVREPHIIQCDVTGKYPTVVHVSFPDEQAIAARANSVAQAGAAAPGVDQAGVQ